MIIYLKLITDAFRALKQLIFFENFLRLNNYKFFRVVELFFVRTIYSIPNIKYNKKIHYSKNYSKENLFETAIKAEEILNNLDYKGYSNAGLIHTDIFNTLANDCKFLIDNELKTHNQQDQKNFIKNKLNGRLSIKIDPSYNNIKKFSLSNLNLWLAKKYLGTNKITLSANILYSVNGFFDKIHTSKNAQLFHVDNDFKKFFKIFIYLDDVDNFNGPHKFIEGSHKNKRKDNFLLRRYSDNEIMQNYKKRIRTFLGKKGSTFYIDTFGIHKGEVPKNNSRKVLILEYGSHHLKYHINDLELKLS
jgi:hypothetical protein